MATPDDPIDDLLARFEAATPPQPASAVHDVWRRIADAESDAVELSIRERIERAFARPAFSTAVVIASVLGGLFLAEIRVSRKHAEESALIEQEYVRTIAPVRAELPASPANPPRPTP